VFVAGAAALLHHILRRGSGSGRWRWPGERMIPNRLRISSSTWWTHPPCAVPPRPRGGPLRAATPEL